MIQSQLQFEQKNYDPKCSKCAHPKSWHVGSCPCDCYPFIAEQKQKNSEQKTKVLNALRSARSSGLTNIQLNEICFRYGARLFELKREGFTIHKQHIEGRVFRYTLSPENW